MQSALYGFRFVDAHDAYHTDAMHQTEKGIYEHLMVIFARNLTSGQSADVTAAARSSRKCPLLRLPTRGLKNLSVKCTAVEQGDLFKCMPVALLAARGATRLHDFITVSSGEILQQSAHPLCHKVNIPVCC